jgi:hypothetical protein
MQKTQFTKQKLSDIEKFRKEERRNIYISAGTKETRRE